MQKRKIKFAVLAVFMAVALSIAMLVMAACGNENGSSGGTAGNGGSNSGNNGAPTLTLEQRIEAVKLALYEADLLDGYELVDESPGEGYGIYDFSSIIAIISGNNNSVMLYAFDRVSVATSWAEFITENGGIAYVSNCGHFVAFKDYPCPAHTIVHTILNTTIFTV